MLKLENDVSAISAVTGEKANLNILEKLPLISPDVRKPSAPKRASTVQPLGRRKSSNVQPDTNGNRAAFSSMLPPPTKADSIPDYSRFKVWAQETISKQQNDINRLSDTLVRVEGEMGTFRDFMTEVRAELASNQEFQKKQIQSERGLAKVFGEVDQLQEHINVLDLELRGKSGQSLSKDIEIIISDMQQVIEKAYEVNDVKTEVQKLKTMVKDAGDAVQNTQRPDEANSLRLELQTLKIRLRIVEEAVNQASPPPSSTQNSAVFNTSALERVQSRPEAGKRLPRVEIQAPRSQRPPSSRGPGNQRESMAHAHDLITHLQSPNATTKESDDIPQNPSLKRKYSNIEKPSERPAGQEAPTKRRKTSRKSEDDKTLNGENGTGSSHVQFKASGPEIIDLLSPEREPSAILDEQAELDEDNPHGHKIGVNEEASQKFTLNDASHSASKATRGRPRKGSLRKTVSMNNLTTPAKAMLQDAPVLEPENHRPQSRNSRSSLKTLSGKTDRRSLRWSKQETSNKENEAPVPADQDVNYEALEQALTVEYSASERIQKANTRGSKQIRSNSVSSRLPNSQMNEQTSPDAPLPSIERDEQDKNHATYPESLSSDTGRPEVEKHSEAPTLEPEASTPTAVTDAPLNSSKPFICEVCGKGYSGQAWLNNVSLLHSFITMPNEIYSINALRSVARRTLLDRRDGPS